MGETRTQLPRTDFHIHASGYRPASPRPDMTLPAIAARCAGLGLEAIGVLDHVNDSPKHPLESFLRLSQACRAAASPLPAYLGAELDIIDSEGGLSGPAGPREALGLDYVIASVHRVLSDANGEERLIEENHRLLMGAITRGRDVDVIGHPWAALRKLNGAGGGWPRFQRVPGPFLRELLAALREHGKAIDLSPRSQGLFQDEAFLAFMAAARDAGVKVAVGSDAHELDALPDSLPVYTFLDRMRLPAEQVWAPTPGA